MVMHIRFPAMFLFRYTKEQGSCFTAERLTKKVLEQIWKLGNDITVWKAHSLRGATATHLLAQGCPQTLVQARGHWSNQGTLERYYNRLHQQQDWETLLVQKKHPSAFYHFMGGPAGGRQTGLSAVLPLPPSLPETTEEVDRGEGKGASTAHKSVLNAHGVLRPLYDTMACPTCSDRMNHEAAYRCQKCRNIFHTRCMASHAAVGGRKTRTSTQCFLCAMAASLHQR